MASNVTRALRMPFVLHAQFQDDVGTTQHYIPFNSTVENTAIGQEYTGFIAPFDLKLQKVALRCSQDISGATWTIAMWAIDSGATHTHHNITGANFKSATGGAADTNAIFDFTGTVGLGFSATGGSNAVTAGQWVDFAINAQSDETTSAAEFWLTFFFMADLSNTI